MRAGLLLKGDAAAGAGQDAPVEVELQTLQNAPDNGIGRGHKQRGHRERRF